MHLSIYTFSSPSTDKSSCVTLTGSTPSPAHLSCFPRLLHSISRKTSPPESGCGLDLQVIKEARAAAAASLHPSFLIYEMTIAAEPTFQGIVGVKSTTESFSLFGTPSSGAWQAVNASESDVGTASNAGAIGLWKHFHRQ